MATAPEQSQASTPQTALSSPLPTLAAPRRVRRNSVQKEWLAAVRQRWVGSSPRTRMQWFVVAVLSLAAVSVFLNSAAFTGARHSVELVQSAWLSNTRNPYVEPVVESVIEASTAVVVDAEPAETPSPSPTPSPAPTPSPSPAFASEQDRICFYQRDVGVISELQAKRQVFCARSGDEKSVDPSRRTQVTYVDLSATGIHMRAMVFQHDLELDFTRTSVNHPIKSLAQDGGEHDPRLKWDPAMVSCGCGEFEAFSLASFRASGNRTTLRPWEPMLAETPAHADPPTLVCGAAPPTAGMPTVPPPLAHAPVVEIAEKTILITRRDDHNPFFQVSSALNGWLLMRTMGWKREETRVVHMDGGYPSPVDELHHRLLSSPAKFALLRGADHLLGHKFRFTNEVLVAPYETTGPMMQHLDDFEPCQRSQLLQQFRGDALAAMGVHAPDYDTAKQITVTVISRRNYNGRKVSRRWTNEDSVIAAMRDKYTNHSGVPIVFQSVEFVDLTLQQQMEITLQSDVVIGMHGAGMVNVLWTKPGTLVLEIFPRLRKRWGYRNLCQYLGCDWHEFRGGRDTGRGDNASDKAISVEVWDAFFGPRFRDHLDKIAATKVASLATGTVVGEPSTPSSLRR